MSNRATARVPGARVAAAPRTAPSRPVPRPSRPQLRVVAPPVTRPRRNPRRSLRSRRAPFVLLVVALLAGTTLGLLVLNTAIAVDSLEASRLRADNSARAQEVQRAAVTELERRRVRGDAVVRFLVQSVLFQSEE